MKKLLVANWKLNPLSEKEALRLARAIDAPDVVVAPPFPFLPAVSKTIKKAVLGAQDMFWENQGAYTGEVSGAMLKNLSVTHVIIGHSERRALGETDEMINKKIKAAIDVGLNVILCVGEPWDTRKKGLHAAMNFIKKQLEEDLRGLGSFGRGKMFFIAYEPIWAIGSGKSDNPEETAEIVRFIKYLPLVGRGSQVTRVLYGGSVTQVNAKQFLARKELDGLLVGGASTRPHEFKKIIAYAARI